MAPCQIGDGLVRCAVCSLPASLTCLSCEKVHYCSQEHLDQDLPNHKATCSAFEVRKNELYGRYVIATRDLAPGDLVLRETAYAFGPKPNSVPICLGCTELLEEDNHRCSRCQYPLCSSECEGNEQHQIECAVLAAGGAKARPKIDDFSEPAPYLECVVTLRVLKLREADPTMWERVMDMDPSPSAWRQSELSQVYQHNVVNFLRTVCKVDADEKLLHKIGGILVTNAFEARGLGRGVHVRCLFPDSGLLAHSCQPNVHHTVDHNYTMYLRAAVPVKKGEVLFTSYTHCLSGTMVRREHLRYSKFFNCACERCADPAELGTYFSALHCYKCGQGSILPVDSLNVESEWCCSECPFKIPAANVRKLCRVLQQELDGADTSDTIEHELFIRKYSQVLHPKHYLLFDARHRLSQMYGRTLGMYLQDLTETHLKRKIELCQEVLSVTKKNLPGIARITGLTYYELHAPQMVLAQRLHDRAAISRAQFKARLQESLTNLRQAVFMLGFEPAQSMEGKICQVARQNVVDLEQLISSCDDAEPADQSAASDQVDQLVGSFNAMLELMDAV